MNLLIFDDSRLFTDDKRSWINNASRICIADACGLLQTVCGRLRVLSEKDGRAEGIVEEIAQGGTAGELGVLSDEVQPTSVVALRDSVLLEFSHDDFRELAARYPRLNIWLARLMSVRLWRSSAGGTRER